MHSAPSELEKIRQEKLAAFKKGKSMYADRDTVGKIYNDAAKTAKAGDTVENGDLTRELMSSLVCDLNDTIMSNPYGGAEFYITIHEKKDLMMPRAILRRMITTKYRPFPEDDTIVYWANPSTNEVCFCWCLPHWSEMENMLANSNLFAPEMINQIRAYRNENYWCFGFKKDDMGNWVQNEHFKDAPLKETVHEFKSNLIYPKDWNMK
jgi:hypothetical protein